MLSQLHFQHPYWLLALLPLAYLLWQLKSPSAGARSWVNVIDKNLLPLLMQGEDRQTGKMIKWLLGLGWLLAVLALADPVWEKIPRPVFQTNSARVIVLDLSNSMLINDLKPSRLARARFKVEDILSRQEEGQIGLVVFAGDAFTASPLTRDADTIRSLLKVLDPNLMPAQGSRADLGIEKAHELLKQANINNGQVLLITDGASDLKKAEKAAQSLKKDGHTLSILAVGTKEGGKLQLSNNQIVTVPLDINKLEKIAKKGGGVLHTITSNDSDLKAVLKTTIDSNKAKKQQAKDLKSNDWKSTGPYLVLLLLPLAALAFRKGWLLSLLLCATVVVSLSPDKPLMAAENEPPATTNKASTNKTAKSLDDSALERLFENQEQRAAKALLQKEYDKASALTKDPLRKGSAEYKKGNFEQALESFKTSKGADARYNEGNALAKLKKYKEAIKAYEEALKENPDMADARANKKALEDFLKKQQEQQKKHQNQQKKNQQQNKDNKKGQKNKQDQNQSEKKNSKDQNKQNKDQKSQNKKGGKQQQDQKNQSGKDQKQGEKGKQNSKDNKGKQDKNKKNQFSEANKELDKKSKKEKGDEKKQASQAKDQQAKGQKKEEADKNESKNNNKNNEAKDKQSASSKGKEKKEDAKKGKDKKTAEKQSQEQAKKKQENAENAKAKAKAEELSKEEKMAAEQWLRRIPDDPGGLLRRKFKSQYQRRSRSFTNEKPW